MSKEIKKLMLTGYIQRPAYNLDRSEKNIIFDYDWVTNLEYQNNNYIYINMDNANKNKDVDLTQDNNNNNNSNLDESDKMRNEYDMKIGIIIVETKIIMKNIIV
ncbi:9912_t:CDS:2 [Cetraspora pellucida]|uniref:9912_t:CDS:1 n=1 Tax=Cetraspora pellucida TaxID=1433469 RepID=A0A9N9DYF4_9GLOM|nr:9912_t:CDS:2 [Cetraspora pellucida]